MREIYLYQRPESLSLTTRSVTVGPGIIPVSPPAIAYPRPMPTDLLMSGTGGYLDNMLWDAALSKLSMQDRAVCATASKKWRSAVLRITGFSYQICEETPWHSKTATLAWKLTPPIQYSSLFDISAAAAAVAAGTCSLNIELWTRAKQEPFWQQNRTIGEIDLALASVVENARSHRAFDTLSLFTDHDTMPILLQHIPPTIRVSISSLCMKLFGSRTAPAKACFQGLIFPNLKSLAFGGCESDIQNIPGACPQLSHLEIGGSEGQLQHLRNLPQLVDLVAKQAKWSDVEGLTRLTRLDLSGWNTLHSGLAAVLPTFTHLHSLTMRDDRLMTHSEVLSLQLALNSVAPSLSGLSVLSIRFALHSLVISDAFTGLQGVSMTTQMQLAAPADATAVKRLIMKTEAGALIPAAAASAPFPTSCTHIRAPLHKLSAAIACARVTHLVVDPMICADAYMEQLLSSVTAGAWPDAVEVMLTGHLVLHVPDYQHPVYLQIDTIPFTGNLLLLDAIASRPGISTLQRVSISALLVQDRQAADEVVAILCRIPSLKRVRIQYYNVSHANLVQLASQQNMEVVEVMQGGIDQAGCDAAQALAGGVAKIQCVERVFGFGDNSSWNLDG